MRAAVCLFLAVVAADTLASDRDVEISPPAMLTTQVGVTLAIDLPSGDIRIQPSQDGQLHAEVRFFCDADSERCRENAAAARIVHEQDGDRSTLRFEPEDAYATKHANMEVDVSVPLVEDLDIRMDAGRLDIDSPTGCLTVRAGAGQVLVAAPADSVATVMLDANLGDATLDVPRGNTQSRRPLLVGAEVRWDDGLGSCDLRVKLQTGEIKARLD